MAFAGAAESHDEDDGPGMKRPRLVYDRPDYNESPWARMLRDQRLHQLGTREARVFRRNFRLPYPVFVELMKMVKELRWFTARAMDVSGRPCIPLELKVRLSRSSDSCHRNAFGLYSGCRCIRHTH